LQKTNENNIFFLLALKVEVGQQLFAKTTRDTGGLGAQDVKAAILLGSKGKPICS
jgi:hypothetical protein